MAHRILLSSPVPIVGSGIGSRGLGLGLGLDNIDKFHYPLFCHTEKTFKEKDLLCYKYTCLSTS